MTLQPPELSVSQAIAESRSTVRALETLAGKHRQHHRAVDGHQTIRHWQKDAGTYCYQTHIAISGQSKERLTELANTLYSASTLHSQPWYPQFLGGEATPVAADTPPGIGQHQLSVGQFDLGLRSPRYYRQLMSLAWPRADTAVIVARSVDSGPTIAQDASVAYTLAPNGEVLHWADSTLHWHHICCTPGAAIVPGIADRWLINMLRWLRLDSAERKTYRDEAVNMRDWLKS